MPETAHTHAHTHTDRCRHIHTHTSICTHRHSTHADAPTFQTHTHTHTHTHTNTHTQGANTHAIISMYAHRRTRTLQMQVTVRKIGGFECGHPRGGAVCDTHQVYTHRQTRYYNGQASSGAQFRAPCTKDTLQEHVCVLISDGRLTMHA